MKVVFLVALLLAAFAALLLFSPKARAFSTDLAYGASQVVFGHMAHTGLILGVYKFPEGTRFMFSSSALFAAAKSVTALSNASPALATSAAHGFVDGDEILLDSGWEDAKNTIWRADQQDVNSFLVLGLNSLNTAFYPAGSGIGTATKVGAWTQIPQVLGVNTSGGDPRYTTVNPLASRNSVNIPTGFNAANLTLTMAHDPADTTFQSMIDISRTLTPVAFKMILGGGGTTYGYGFMAVNESPSLNVNQVNQVNQVTVALAFQGRQISYGT